jgi:hypothetical protein
MLPGLRGFANEMRKAPPVIEGEGVEIMPRHIRAGGAPQRRIGIDGGAGGWQVYVS